MNSEAKADVELTMRPLLILNFCQLFIFIMGMIFPVS
jgi:hypothetical protein